ncbi:hypothetical protein CC86DRAFT_111878 [Ophiobolus disseminans]|uniref:Uncharacterized protein n=1 Tax=Ophiobolus disseminans TaxID=1469910 RepID=A0A6A6ZIR9_9PLEO|nr:hypothetical protein CC86DRAFT_111878 [Ophiobolus disseminans]
MQAHQPSLNNVVAAYNQHVLEVFEAQVAEDELVIEYETLLSRYPQHRAQVISRLSPAATNVIRRNRNHEFKNNKNATADYCFIQNHGRWCLTWQELDTHLGIWWSKPRFLRNLRLIDQETNKSFIEAVAQINLGRPKELRARHVKAALDLFLETETIDTPAKP